MGDQVHYWYFSVKTVWNSWFKSNMVIINYEDIVGFSLLWFCWTFHIQIHEIGLEFFSPNILVRFNIKFITNLIKQAREFLVLLFSFHYCGMFLGDDSYFTILNVSYDSLKPLRPRVFFKGELKEVIHFSSVVIRFSFHNSTF